MRGGHGDREQGNWLWSIKDWIDRSWMARYSAPALLTSMPSPISTDAAQFALQQQATAAAAGCEATVAAAQMRCSGCASKVHSCHRCCRGSWLAGFPARVCSKMISSFPIHALWCQRTVEFANSMGSTILLGSELTVNAQDMRVPTLIGIETKR